MGNAGWRLSKKAQPYSQRYGRDAEKGAAAAAAGHGRKLARDKNPNDPGTLQFQSRFLIAQNLIGALLSVPVLVTGFLIAEESRRDPVEHCATFMHRPIIAVGALLLLLSLIGLVIALLDKFLSRPVALLSWLHLLLMFCVVIILFCFSIFSLEVTNENLGHSVHAYGISYKEYRLYEYPKWMQHRVGNQNYWSKVKSCLMSSPACNIGDIPNFSSNITYIPIESLSPIQKGCCLPPSACGVQYTGSQAQNHEGTNNHGNIDTRQNRNKSLKIHMEEIDLSTSIHAYTRDCNKWNSDPYQLCYSCDTCKAGVIQANMSRWKKAGILYVVLVVIMVFVYALFSCYGFVKEKIESTR